MDCYRDHLLELEGIISDSILIGPVIILGDFNAHLGPLGGVCGSGNPNIQGILIADIMDRHNLCAVSQCEWATGPLHTYASGNSMTTVDYIIATVDYIIASLDSTSIISSSVTLPMTDLNLSDHLPLVAELTQYGLNPIQLTIPVNAWTGNKQIDQEKSMNIVGL